MGWPSVYVLSPSVVSVFFLNSHFFFSSIVSSFVCFINQSVLLRFNSFYVSIHSIFIIRSIQNYWSYSSIHKNSGFFRSLNKWKSSNSQLESIKLSFPWLIQPISSQIQSIVITLNLSDIQYRMFNFSSIVESNINISYLLFKWICMIHKEPFSNSSLNWHINFKLNIVITISSVISISGKSEFSFSCQPKTQSSVSRLWKISSFSLLMLSKSVYQSVLSYINALSVPFGPTKNSVFFQIRVISDGSQYRLSGFTASCY